MNASNLVRMSQKFFSKYASEILIGMGITGMVSAGIMAVPATVKAVKKIEAKTEVDNKGNKVYPTKTEIVKDCWKLYVPSITTAIISGGCIIGASSINAKRNAALMTAYALSESARQEYVSKVVETIGEKKEQEIRDKIAEDKIRNNPVNESTVIVTGNGSVWCYDPLCDRYFQSSVDAIKKAENEFNRKLRNELFMYVNDWYDELNLDHTQLGDLVGWDIDKGGMSLAFSSKIASNDQPCLVLDYRTIPYAQ